MKAALFLALVYVTAGCATSAHAQVTNCSDSDQSQVDKNICAYKAFVDADASLNKTYGELVTYYKNRGSGKANVAALQTAETVWISFRDLECTFETVDNAGGAVQTLRSYECKTKLTSERDGNLSAFLAEANSH